ncbi:hypothetical protein GCM10017557_34130 [Streptomyces aurantiacus]|uniref:Uncharacterized protein n=1 Tax=Streptomyces aurantiacus TaxID=47760 RepID=A0A7G1P3Z0_9ACTN|nr:hypothetical protein GCM10017557_34130 [Streptomyces aurantiacus]
MACAASLGDLQSAVFPARAMSRHIAAYAALARFRATSAGDADDGLAEDGRLATASGVPPLCEGATLGVSDAVQLAASNTAVAPKAASAARHLACVYALAITTVTSPRERRR